MPGWEGPGPPVELAWSLGERSTQTPSLIWRHCGNGPRIDLLGALDRASGLVGPQAQPLHLLTEGDEAGQRGKGLAPEHSSFCAADDQELHQEGHKCDPRVGDLTI